MGFTTLVLTQMLLQVLGWVFSFLAGLFVLRFIMQWTRAPFRNPVGQFVMTLTDWGVLRARRFVPGWRGLDLSSLLLAWLVETVSVLAALFILSVPATTSGEVLPLAFAAGFVEVLRTAAYVIIGATLGVVVLSWVNPHAPLAPLVDAIAGPFLRPFQRRIPPIGGIDLSPLILLVALQLALGILASLKHGLLRVPL
jgi:YggT family protein